MSSAVCTSEFCNRGWSEILTHMSPYGFANFGVALGLGLSIVGAAWGIWLTGSSCKLWDLQSTLDMMEKGTQTSWRCWNEGVIKILTQRYLFPSILLPPLIWRDHNCEHTKTHKTKQWSVLL